MKCVCRVCVWVEGGRGVTTRSTLLEYSETCANGHLYSETTCIKRPFRDVPKVSVQYLLTCIQRPPLYKGHYEVALAWPLNTGFTVCEFLAFCFN